MIISRVTIYAPRLETTARARRLTVLNSRRKTSGDHDCFGHDIDADIDEENFRIRFENGVTQSASLVKHFVDERAEVCLVLGMERGRFGAGQEHLYSCLRRLALVQPARAQSTTSHLQEMLDNATRSEYRLDANYWWSFLQRSRIDSSNIWRRAFVIYLSFRKREDVIVVLLRSRANRRLAVNLLLTSSL